MRRRSPASICGGTCPNRFLGGPAFACFLLVTCSASGRGRFSTNPVVFAQIQDSYLRRSDEPLAPGELRTLLLDSVRHHMVSDVPVGVFLSAGIDSNVIAALAAELGTEASNRDPSF